jgi:hypothetical protein
MSETIDPQSPKQPMTRREALEKGQGIRSTVSEPLPDVMESGYHGVLVRSDQVTLKHRGFMIAAFTMVFVSFITFYIPFLNALLGGAFGGFFAKRWGPAFGAAAVASVAVPGLLAFLYDFGTRGGFLFFLSGLGFWGWTALHVAGMFIGAASGVYSRPLADRRGVPRELTGE